VGEHPLRRVQLLLFMGYHTDPPIIVSEFMQRGSLQTYLRRRQVSHCPICVACWAQTR
jgi:hypothetical protein